MNQLETNLVLWAICSILLFELLIVICICRCCFNRIKPKRFYVKREEYEYLQGLGATQSHFQSTILRPPHADELALIGTIRAQNPTVTFDDGFENFGFYRDTNDENNDQRIPPRLTIPPPPSESPRPNWIELRSPPSNAIINTEYLPPAEYEVHTYPSNSFVYTHQSPPPRPNIIDFRSYQGDYDEENFQSVTNDYEDNDDDELENFRLQPFRRPDLTHTQIPRLDTSTESYAGNYSTITPKSILKGHNSTTPPLDILSKPYSPKDRDYTSSKYDQSPRTSVKVNTDESIPIDYPISAIERFIPAGSFFAANEASSPSSSSLSSSHRMRFASVSRLNDIEWEVPSEFQTVVYDLTDDTPESRSTVIYRSNENLNLNNNNNNNDNNNSNNEIFSNRRRSQSVSVDQRSHISRIFVPWSPEQGNIQQLYLANDIENNHIAQRQAFEY